VRPGRYAAADGSFARSAGGAGARGIALLAIALLIGIVLLNATSDDPPGTSLSTGSGTPSTDDGSADKPTKAATTTTVPPTTTLPARAPKDVKVIVANASSVKGAATKASDVLKPPGYNVLAPANAATAKESSVFFTPGYDRDAAAIAAALQFPPTSVKPLPAPSPRPAVTTTTRPAVTTTKKP
jgi:hypothetical protein